MKILKTLRVGIYARVSTEEQAKEGFSISAQRDRNAAFVQSQGWEIHDFYIDEGQSAKDTNRPELQRLLGDVAEKKIDIVLVFRLDRLTRSVLDLYKLLETFDRHGVAFRSATEVYDTTSAIGRLFITLVAALAQWERENLGERVWYGMEQMAKEGKRPGGTVNYGYISDNGLLIPAESQAAVIRMIYNLYERNIGIRDIQKQLVDGGYPPPRSHWSPTTINHILRNPVYVGKLRWNYRSRAGKTGEEFTVQGGHTPIISQEQYDRVQGLLDKRKIMEPVAATSDYIFSGVVFCSRCGYKLSGTSRKYVTKRTKYYSCINRMHNNRCDLPYLQEEWIETAFLDKISSFSLQTDSISRLEVAASKEDDNEDDAVQRVEELNKELERVRARKKRFQLLYVDEEISKSDYLERNKELTTEEEQLSRMIQEIVIPDESISRETELIETLMNYAEMYGTLDTGERKTIIQEMVLSIRVDAHKDQEKRDKPSLSLEIQYN
ncbi:recombinase family protein [Paenibacillus sp. HJGM_3]|uniref:recombinase family protein n=1 Tax=Paenibacillus sp. HJGM_3 TaxID=3379816 RepID=UPI00385BE145